MKNRLSALNASLAMLAAATSAAHAQSSMTLFGIVDVGFEALTGAPNAGGRSSTLVRQTSGNLSGSRWGLRGIEDLGHGLKALFVLENGFNANNGTLGQNGRLFGRQAYAGLQGRFGTVTLGRQQTLLFDMVMAYDPMVYAVYSSVTQDEALVGRADNSIKYTGKFNGLTLAAMYSIGFDSTIDGSAQVPGYSKAGREYSAGVSYATGPFDIGLVYDQQQGSSVASADDTARRVYVGASYKFRKTDFYAAYRFLQQRVGVTQTRATLYWAGATQHVTPALQLSAAAYHTDTLRSNQDPTSYVLSLDYFLSKRTDFYLSASYASNKDGSNLGVNGFGANIVPGENQLGAMAGIRHRF